MPDGNRFGAFEKSSDRLTTHRRDQAFAPGSSSTRGIGCLAACGRKADIRENTDVSKVPGCMPMRLDRGNSAVAAVAPGACTSVGAFAMLHETFLLDRAKLLVRRSPPAFTP